MVKSTQERFLAAWINQINSYFRAWVECKGKTRTSQSTKGVKAKSKSYKLKQTIDMGSLRVSVPADIPLPSRKTSAKSGDTRTYWSKTTLLIYWQSDEVFQAAAKITTLRSLRNVGDNRLSQSIKQCTGTQLSCNKKTLKFQVHVLPFKELLPQITLSHCKDHF